MKTQERTLSLIERDRAHAWHPFTQHGTEPDPLPVVGAQENPRVAWEEEYAAIAPDLTDADPLDGSGQIGARAEISLPLAARGEITGDLKVAE